MSRVVAIVNQKGGVGKTATAVSLAAALAIAERSTLLIDADPQANSTRALGFPEDPERASLYEAIRGDASLTDLKLPVKELPCLSLVPADQNLVGAEIELVEQPGREYRMRQILEAATDTGEHVFIDCPPSLGLLTLNAVVAADSVLIPVQCE